MGNRKAVSYTHLDVYKRQRIDYEHTMTAVSYIARLFDKILNESE